MERIRTGIIGCGKGAHLHAQALLNLPESVFTGVYSRTFKSAQSFAEKYNVKAYESIEEMAEKGGIEAVIICTPHPAHAKVAVRAAKAGMHLVEKPWLLLWKMRMPYKRAKDNGVTLGTISQRRLSCLDAGKTGD